MLGGTNNNLFDYKKVVFSSNDLVLERNTNLQDNSMLEFEPAEK